MPKSSTFTWPRPSAVSLTLAGFRSRWRNALRVGMYQGLRQLREERQGFAQWQ